MKKRKNIYPDWHSIPRTKLEKEFENWFRNRGEFYASLIMKRYVNGEPYFSNQGAECTLRDYLRVKEEEKITPANV